MSASCHLGGSQIDTSMFQGSSDPITAACGAVCMPASAELQSYLALLKQPLAHTQLYHGSQGHIM